MAESRLLLPLLVTFSCASSHRPPAAVSTSPIRVASTDGARPSWTAEYPSTRTVDTHELRFGMDVRDLYRWLEDGGSPDVQAWMQAQHQLTRRRLDALPERAALAKRLRELAYEENRSVPIRRGQRLFYEARSGTQEKSALYWQGLDGKDHVLLDPNRWPSQDNASLTDWTPSWDGSKIAFTVALHNADTATLQVLDVASGVESPVDRVPDQMLPAPSFSADGKGFYYRFMPPAQPGQAHADRFGLVELRYHRLGEDPARDQRVRDKTGDPTAWLSGEASRDGHWLFSAVTHGQANEVWFRDLRRPSGDGEWTALIDRSHGKNFVRTYRDRFYVLTNDGAPNWRVFVVDPAHPTRDRWSEIVPERRDARLEDFTIVGGRLVLRYFKDVNTHLEVHRLDGALERELSLPAIVDASVPLDSPDDDSSYFGFSSLTQPFQITRVSIASGELSTWYRVPVKADLSQLEEEQVFYRSKDGTRVPMFLLHKKGQRRDGSTPVLLTGYGGFDRTYGPTFPRARLPWIERGGMYAWADIRGGGEYGESWHRGGMLHNKQNVFDDFAAAAEYLIRERYTTADRLVATGASNGGLLVGASLTQRPELFRVILCNAPLLDMIRYPLFGAGKIWVKEYGDPTQADDFRALFAYSPVHHVQRGLRYPSVLMMSPADDDRVDPLHARKLVALLQAASSGGPVLLRVERNAGHFGADSRSAWAEQLADQYAFALAEIERVGATMR